MKLVHYTTPPPVGNIVFALNSNGYIGIVVWDGENYRIPDCSDTERKNEKQSFFCGTIYNPQKGSITNNTSFWIDLEYIVKSENRIILVDMDTGETADWNGNDEDLQQFLIENKRVRAIDLDNIGK